MATPQIPDIFLEREFPITLMLVFQAKKQRLLNAECGMRNAEFKNVKVESGKKGNAFG
jgi:hypothetical protein